MMNAPSPLAPSAPVQELGELSLVKDPSLIRVRDPEEVFPVARLPEEWKQILVSWGEKPFRARQIFRWIHQRGVFSPEEMTDLSLSLRQRLAREGLAAPGEVTHVHESADGTRKFLTSFVHGAKIETVLIPMTPNSLEAAEESELEDGEDPYPTKKRITLCISTQFGCAMKCVFCASGQSGLFRGLGAAEVVFQVLAARRFLRPDEEIRNLVFMGMGEPLHHYDVTARALRLLTHPECDGMSPRRITVSTVGLVPGIQRLGEDFGGKIGLAVSLHAPDDETRSRIVPMNKSYSVAQIIQALKNYPLPPRRRMTIEYTLIQGVNDSLEHAEKLTRLLRSLRVKINLIPMNGIEGSELQSPSSERIVQFREHLVSRGYSCFVRTRRGDDVSAACGQLAMQAVAPQRLLRRK